MAKNQSWRELFKRATALGFAAAYTHTHQLERDAALRVAYWAYRFMDGDDVAEINKAADEANRLRETPHHQHKQRVPRMFGLTKGSK